MSKKDYPPKPKTQTEAEKEEEAILREIAEQEKIIEDAKNRKKANEEIAKPLREKIKKGKTTTTPEKKVLIPKNKESESKDKEVEPLNKSGKVEDQENKSKEPPKKSADTTKVIAHMQRVIKRLEEVEQRQSELSEPIRFHSNVSEREENDELKKEERSLYEELDKIQREFPEIRLENVQNKSKEREIKKINTENKNDKTSGEVEEKGSVNDTKLKNIKADLDKTFQKQNEEKQNKIITDKLKIVGLTEKDLDSKEWQGFSVGEKLLVIEQLSQETLAHVKEIGEKRFREKNKINFSWNPAKWAPFSVLNKIKNNIGKAYWISKAEKEVIEEVQLGKIKPSEQSIITTMERTADMHLNVVEQNGKAVVEFIPIDKNLPEEQQKIIKEYNRVANEFAHMPDSWRNKKSADSKDTGFHKKNYENFMQVKTQYEKTKAELLKLKEDQYLKLGITGKEAAGKSMLDVKDSDFRIAILQFMNTNPDVTKELNKIKNESSWGRLVNNENIWRSIYMAGGFAVRSATISTLGALAAPIVGGAIGGIRARRKAGEKINLAFNEGRKIETLKERKDAGKKGLFDDKDKNHNLISKTLSGYNVSGKEVGAFIDADSQIQRLDNIIGKIEQAKTNGEKLRLKDQLIARINYIEDKNNAGLINYGSKNAIGLNYELFKKLSYAESQLNALDFIDSKSDKLTYRRSWLLYQIMKNNELKFGKKQVSFKNQEMARGAVVAAGFSILGWKIRDWIGGDEGEIANNLKIDDEFNNPIGRTLPGQDELNNLSENTNVVEHTSVEAVADHGQGAISTLRELQNNLKAEYGNDLENAPASVKHIINTDAHKLAQEYGMYKPGQDAESMLIKSGASFKVNGEGNVIFYESPNSDGVILQEGDSLKAEHLYEGKMVDTDHSGERIKSAYDLDQNTYKLPPQVNPETGEIISDSSVDSGGILNSSESANLVDNEYEVPPQVNPETGEAIDQSVQQTDKENIISGSSETKPLEPNKDADEQILSGESETKYVLTPQELAKVNQTYDENINHLFPTEKSMLIWDKIHNRVSAEKIMEMHRGNEISSEYKPLTNYMEKLEKVSGLKPRGATIEHPEAETIPDYMNRALQKIQSLNRLDEVKLTNNESPDQFIAEQETGVQEVELNTENNGQVAEEPEESNSPLSNDESEEPNKLKEAYEKATVEFDLDPEARDVYENNISHIFVRPSFWGTTSLREAKDFMDKDWTDQTMKKLDSYLENLKKVTGLEPEGKESIKNYMVRALKETQKIGKLDEVKL